MYKRQYDFFLAARSEDGILNSVWCLFILPQLMWTMLFIEIPVPSRLLLLLLLGETLIKRLSGRALLPGQIHFHLGKVRRLANHQTALFQPHLRPQIIFASLLPVGPVVSHATPRPLLSQLRLCTPTVAVQASADGPLLLMSVAQWRFCLPLMPVTRFLCLYHFTRRPCALPSRFSLSPAKPCRTKAPRV